MTIKINLDEHTLDVLKKSVASTFVRIGSVVLGFLVSIFLGRFLGPEGLGILGLSDRVISVFMLISLFGFPQLLIKEVSLARNLDDFDKISSKMYSSYLFCGGIAVIFSVLGVVFSEYISVHIFQEHQLIIALALAFLVMIFQVLSRIFASGLVGFQKVWQSNLVNEGLSVLFIAFFLLNFWIFSIPIDVINVAMAYAVSRVLVTTIVGFYWGKVFKFQFKIRKVEKEIIKEAFPFFLVSATGFLASSIDILMIGIISNSREVGLYTVAFRIAMVTSFFLQITNSALSPKLATLFSEKKIKAMNQMVQKVTLILLVVSLVPIIIYVIFGNEILKLWGNDFGEAFWILLIISLGQFFNVGSGSAGLLLVMCGYEKIQAKISVVSIFINISLNLILIIHFGALGAAIATALTVALENIAKVIIAKRKTGVLSIPLYLFSYVKRGKIS